MLVMEKRAITAHVSDGRYVVTSISIASCYGNDHQSEKCIFTSKWNSYRYTLYFLYTSV